LQLEKFLITKLNGDQNIEICFDENKKVVIAENGSGKTTIMNILYYALKNDVNGLKKYDYEKCILKFSGKNEIIFEKNKLEKINNSQNLNKIFKESRDIELINTNLRAIENLGRLFLRNIGFHSFEKFLIDYFAYIIDTNEKPLIQRRKDKELYVYHHLKKFGFDFSVFEDERLLQRISKIGYADLIGLHYYLNKERFNYQIDLGLLGHSRSEIFEILKKILRFLLLDNIKDDEKDKKSLNVLNDKLVFLPTYRRIEHDSIDLFSEEISLKEGSILSFGVSDVSSLFNKITDKLNIYAVNSFNKINNRALNDFISGEHEIDYSLDNWIDKDEDYFTKVLERVGKEIDENNKLKLKLIFNSKDSEDKFLLKLIRKMCEIYDNQSRIEDEIVKYINVCNKYLYNKKFIYDKETLKFKILQVKKNGILKDIKLSSLSSGEKQIISIFAKLYLSHLPSIDLENILPDRAKEGYWILFDEPELSLSVDWQEILLPDILASNRCEFIFATTHSPFIFNNNFKYMTTHINECMEELDSE